MKNAIILHGRPTRSEYLIDDYPSPSNSHWLLWLQRELLRKRVLAQTPEAKNPYKPSYESWAREIERYNPDKNTILVGHSCGGGMIVQWLSKNPDRKVGKVVLVAPWIDIEKEDWPAFDFEIDENLVARTAGLTIFHSIDDVEEIQTSVKELRQKLKGAKYVEFKDKGHFTHHYMPDDTFPELLEECLKGNS
ncbi:MAG: alpha/beta fold hydrolase [Candidatus Saccharimonadales bacterium]